MTQRNLVEVAVESLRPRLKNRPAVGVVLGSGLGAFSGELQDAVTVPYTEIPHWPASTAVGHAGKLVAGTIGGASVIVLSGRAHLYEGYTPLQAAFATRVLRELGAHSMVFTNAAGGINLSYSQGALVAISDHINLQGANPLTGPNDDQWGPRFPDMTEAYSLAYRAIARRAAQELDFTLPEGIYAALAGPNYETPAEIRFLRTIGADLVGMSTVPEVIAANHMGMRVLAISCVTNMAAGVLDQKIDHEEVLETGRQVRSRFTALLKAVLPQLHG
ncbi:MAG TPA: purine-nucleoside phosphorylase [Bryobacteraceae bacterium]|nr:purine-nucleoside phosphorylase [Bryobacteraceae bacterium]